MFMQETQELSQRVALLYYDLPIAKHGKDYSSSLSAQSEQYSRNSASRTEPKELFV